MSVGLDSALSGLRVAQRQLDVISGNISNASTDGYSRKILNQETQVVGNQVIGVLSSSVIRKVDMNVQKEVWTQVSATSFLAVQSAYMAQIQAFNGPPDKELSIAASLAGLQNDFVKMTNTPDDQTQMGQTLNQAKAAAKKFNDYSGMIDQMRNDSQSQIVDSVNKANSLLKQIAGYNQQIKFNAAGGSSTAALEDQRDTAIKALSQEIGITSFTRGDGVLVVQTTQGQQLADETAQVLTFNPKPLNAQSSYPASAAGLFIGDPAAARASPDITLIGVGGKIGANLEMRDTVLPKYQAQLDEMAQKLALRLDGQGLRLFTDKSGAIPADTDPVPSNPGPATPVTYVGFASQIQVNTAIVRNPQLIQAGTVPNVAVQAGSSEVLRRVADYAFGANAYQQATGTADIRVAGVPSTLQTAFGLNPSALMIGSVDIRTLSSGVPLNAAAGNPYSISGTTLDTFTVRFDAGGPNDTGNLNINLTAVNTAFPAPPAASGAAALVSYLNSNVIAGLGAPLSTKISASINQFGQLAINSQVAVDVGAGNMGTDGLNFIGLKAGSTAPVSPYMDIQVGADNPVRVDVDPGDTEVTLLAKLNAVPGVQASLSITGKLIVRPGPGFGGDLKITAGPVLSSGGNSIVKQLFGTDTPIASVANAPFRTLNLGPAANIKTGVAPSGSIVDYAQKVISAQAQDASTIKTQQADEQSYRDLIEKQFKDDSGVNLDEELSQLIIIQTAYAASGKTVSTLNDMFKELLNSF